MVVGPDGADPEDHEEVAPDLTTASEQPDLRAAARPRVLCTLDDPEGDDCFSQSDSD